MKDVPGRKVRRIPGKFDAVFDLDRAGHFAGANKVFINACGCKLEELQGMHFGRFCANENQERIARFFSQAMQGLDFSFEMAVSTTLRKNLEISIATMPVVAEGEIAGVHCIAHEIGATRRRETEQAMLSTMRNIFNEGRGLTECLRLVLLELCRHYPHVSVAEVWLNRNDDDQLFLATHYSRGGSHSLDDKIVFKEGEGLIGTAFLEKKPLFIPDLRGSTQFVRKLFTENNKIRSVIVIPVLRNQKTISVMAFYSKNVVAPDEPFLELSRNFVKQLSGEIQRRKNDVELRQFFEVTPDLLAIAGLDGYFRKVNSAFTRVLGYQPEELLSRPFIELIHHDDRQEFLEQMEKLSKGITVTYVESRLITNEGKVKWLGWTAASVPESRLIFGTAKDVTERRHLEKNLQSEQDRFSRMFNEAPVSMFIIKSGDYIFTDANNEFYKLTRRTNAIIGKAARAVFPDFELQGLFRMLDHVYQTGETHISNEALVRIFPEDGRAAKVAYLNFMYQPYWNDKGEVEGVFFFGVDVTESVLARKKIEDSEQQLAQSQLMAGIGSWDWDIKSDNLYSSDQMCRILGLAPQSGITYQKFLEFVHPDEKAYMEWLIKQACIDFKPFDFHHRIKRKDNVIRMLHGRGEVIADHTDRAAKLRVVEVDITDSYQAEEELKKLSLITKMTNNAVLITDALGKIEWVNDAFMRLTEYSFVEAVGNEVRDLVYGKKTDRATCKFVEDRIAQGKGFECDMIQYSKSGRSFWLSVQGQPVFDDTGQLAHYFIIKTDITERKRTFDELVKKEAEIRSFAKQLDRVLEDERARIALEIHDEFGQQLTGMKMSLSALRKQGIDQAAKRTIGDLLKDIDKAVHAMRQFSNELRPAILDRLGLVPALEWLVQEFRKKTNIKCTLNIHVIRKTFDKNLATAFFRTCQEALTNIVKHAKASKVSVKLIEDETELMLEIKDNGLGLNNKKRNKPLAMGLTGMRERALSINGKFDFKTNKTSGMTIRLRS